MSVTPLTLQMTIPMTNDASQVQNQENMRASTEHMQFAEANNKQAKANSEMVIPKDTLKFSEYHYDAKEKGNNEYTSQKKKKKREPSLEEDDQEESSLDGKKEKKKQLVQIDIKL